MHRVKQSLAAFLSLMLTTILFISGPIYAQSEDHTGHGEQDASAAATIWTCSMHPQIQLPQPGQCPICFMDLIPVPKNTSDHKRTSLRQITFDRQAQKLARLQSEPAHRGEAGADIHLTGKIEYDETRQGTITAWIPGRIDKLHVAYTGSPVKKGQAMVTLYSPQLLTAQTEVLEAGKAVARLQGTGNKMVLETARRTLAAAEKKLRLFGLTEMQIQKIVTHGSASDHITLNAPMSGIVLEKNVTEGVYVTTGTHIYTIADLASLWVILEAYESDLHGLHLHQSVRFSAQAYPNRLFSGTIDYIDPLVDEKTRTVRLRVNIENKDALLKPGMFVKAVIRSQSDLKDPPLLIPASAPLLTGKRALVYVELPDLEGVYEGREIILGPKIGNSYIVRHGLEEGEMVVSNGNFKIDSAMQIQARPSLMNPYQAEAQTDPADLPPLFLSRLNLLNQHFAALSETVHKQDREGIERNLSTLHNLLSQIKSNQLAHEDQLIWKELAMLLSGDILLLREATDSRETETLYGAMAEHFHQLRIGFSLDNNDAVRLGNEEIRDSMGNLIAAYFELRKNLSGDSLEGALTSIEALRGPADHLSALLAVSHIDRAEVLGRELDGVILTLVESKDMDAIRAAFSPLSRAVIEAVALVGTNTDSPLYEHFCPMAFGNGGATWLADDEDINNPYFGAMMLKCGEVRQQLKD